MVMRKPPLQKPSPTTTLPAPLYKQILHAMFRIKSILNNLKLATLWENPIQTFYKKQTICR